MIFKCTKNQLDPSLLSQLCKLIILSTLGMIDHVHLSVFRTVWGLSEFKNRLHPSRFLEIVQKYYKFGILGTLGMPGYDHQNDDLSFKKTLMFIFMEEINFTPHLILEILLRYDNLLLRALWPCLAMATTKWWSQFEENYVLCKKSNLLLNVVFKYC